MTDLPAPPVPADCDLRGMPGFMLDTERLMASELWALADGPTFKAAVGLWCRAWRQVPAASLPDDDAVLRAFAGMPASAWKKTRDMALRGFVKCSDGRLYHLVLAEDAARAWGHRQMQREKAGKRWGTAPALPRHSHGTATALQKQCQGQGQGQGQGQEVEADASTASASASAAPSTDFLTDDPTGQTAKIIPPGGTLGDLQALHPALLVKSEDRPQASRLLALYGWDPCVAVLREMTAEAKARPHDKRRIFVDQWAARLEAGYQLDADDYRRAGLTPRPRSDPMATPRTAPAQAPQENTADAWTWHARRPTTWWGEGLPTIHDGNIREGRWWTQARTEALILWLGDGAVRALAVALTGTNRDRWSYAMTRTRARWVADLMADAPADLGRVSDLMARPLPEDRLDRAKGAARMLDEIAATVPEVRPGHDRALAVLRHRDLVEAIGSLWGKRHHPGRLGILPEVRARIDHDARMLAADGAFG